MQESVSGKYGGVGLVISSAKTPQSLSKVASLKGLDIQKSSKIINSETKIEIEKTNDIKYDNRKENRNGDGRVTTSNDLIPSSDRGGVVVMDAFERFAYDAGMRIGDRILSVDGVDVRAFNTEQVVL